MIQQNNFVNTFMNQNKFKCDFCNKEFSKERTLFNHLCEKKRRWMNRDEKYVQLGFNSWLKWFEMTNLNKVVHARDYRDFMNSNYYLAFTKFGKHIERTNLINPLFFIEFVIKNNIKLDDWCLDTVYEEYVKEITKREDAQAAIERMINLMSEWANENQENWTDYFKKVNPGTAFQMIRNGKISPWILYNAKTADQLMSRMSDEQKKLLKKIIDDHFWKLKMKKNSDDLNFVKEILEDNGI